MFQRYSTVLLCALLFAAAPVTRGIEFIRAVDFVLPAGERFQTDSWILANNITLSGEASDDVFLCAVSESPRRKADMRGGIVSLTGDFQADVWALGNRVNVAAPVAGHVRLLADRITIAGQISETVILLGNTVEITETSELASGGLIAADTLIAKGTVGGKLDIKARKATLSGVFADDVRVVAHDIVVLPGTRLMGNLFYRSEKELFLDESVAVAGTIERESLPKQPVSPIFAGTSFLVQCWFFCEALLAGLVLACVFPAFLDRAAERTRDHFWTCALYGMVAFFTVPIAIFFSIFSIIGFVPGLLLLTVFATLVYLSKIIVAIAIGSLLLKMPRRNSFWRLAFSMAVGMVILYLVSPFGLIGLAAWCVVTFTGIGAILLALFSPKIPVATAPKP